MPSQLLKAEMVEREVHSIAYHMKAARFLAYKDLSGFDFATRRYRRVNGQNIADPTDVSQ